MYKENLTKNFIFDDNPENLEAMQKDGTPTQVFQLSVKQ